MCEKLTSLLMKSEYSFWMHVSWEKLEGLKTYIFRLLTVSLYDLMIRSKSFKCTYVFHFDFKALFFSHVLIFLYMFSAWSSSLMSLVCISELIEINKKYTWSVNQLTWWRCFWTKDCKIKHINYILLWYSFLKWIF